jgi:hypothetical protein
MDDASWNAPATAASGRERRAQCYPYLS